MTNVSEYKAGNTSPAIRITGRILSKSEYKKIGEDGLKFLLGIDSGKDYEDMKTFIENVFAPVKIAPSPIKKERIKDIDAQISELQKRKKELQERK